jgi:hypothetical protein
VLNTLQDENHCVGLKEEKDSVDVAAESEKSEVKLCLEESELKLCLENYARSSGWCPTQIQKHSVSYHDGHLHQDFWHKLDVSKQGGKFLTVS